MKKFKDSADLCRTTKDKLRAALLLNQNKFDTLQFQFQNIRNKLHALQSSYKEQKQIQKVISQSSSNQDPFFGLNDLFFDIDEQEGKYLDNGKQYSVQMNELKQMIQHLQSFVSKFRPEAGFIYGDAMSQMWEEQLNANFEMKRIIQEKQQRIGQLQTAVQQMSSLQQNNGLIKNELSQREKTIQALNVKNLIYLAQIQQYSDHIVKLKDSVSLYKLKQKQYQQYKIKINLQEINANLKIKSLQKEIQQLRYICRLYNGQQDELNKAMKEIVEEYRNHKKKWLEQKVELIDNKKELCQKITSLTQLIAEGESKSKQMKTLIEINSDHLIKLKNQNCLLKQSIQQKNIGIQNQSQDIQEKSQAIKKLSSQIYQLNKIIEESSLMAVQKAQEWQLKQKNLQNTIVDHCQKIASLSQSIADNQVKKQQMSLSLIQRQISLKQLQTFFNQTVSNSIVLQSRIKNLTALLQVKTNDFSSSIQTIKQCQERILQLQTNNCFLKSQFNELKLQNQAVLQTNHIFKRQAKKLKDLVQSKDQQIAQLKQKIADFIQSELNHQFEKEQLNKKNDQLLNEKDKLLMEKRVQSQNMQTIKTQVNQLRVITQIRIQQFSECLKHPQVLEETTTFQVLQDDDYYEIIGHNEEFYRAQLLKKIDQYRAQVLCIYSKYQ